ncbi:MAG: PAS domain S-box protein, partial [Actinomycetes bacterium]
MSTGADGDVLHWTDGVNPTLVSQAQRAADQHQGRGVVVQDASGIIVAANDGTAGAATSVLGLSWDQLVGRTSRDRHWSSVSEQGLAIPGDQHPAMRTLTTGEPIRGFLMGVFTPGALTRKGLILGRTRWLEISSIPIDPTSGETPVSEAGLAGVVTIFEDVSDTPRGRAASDSLLSYYQLMGEAAFDAMVRTDMDAIISWASDSLWWVLGRDPVAEVGQSVLSWVHPGDSAAIRALISETIADSKHLPAEVRITGSNGEHRWMSVHARGLRDGRDTIVGAVLGLRDIDQQVRSQLATRAAELRFELVADSAADFSFTADRDGRATWVSRSVSKNFGWTPDDLLGTQIADLVHPDDAADVTDYRKQLSSGLAVSPKTTDAVVRMRTKTGQYRWVTGRAEPLVDDDGATTGIVANLRDVGDLVRAQEAVRESEARFRLLAENASDVVWQVSLGNITRWVSPSVEPTLGWRPDELIGTRTFDLIHPDDREMLRGSRTERLSGAPLPSMELRLRTADGSYRWMSLQARVITDDKGSAEDVILWLRDVNQEVEARDALQASEARYRLLAENASDVVWQVDPGGHLAWCSESVTSVLGWSREQIVGKIATDLMHPEDRDRALNARAEVLAGGTAHGETRVLCAD